jgi:phosphoribosylaminoimidazole-succinocarboxamide synthase
MTTSTSSAISETSFQLPGQTGFYRGKVRDVYVVDDEWLIMVATDRISAFDCILPKPVPFKGQVLNQMAAGFLAESSTIAPNWYISSPDPNVTIGRLADPYPVEMVIRGYLSGHAWREYRDGKRELCGVPLPDGLNENDQLPEPIITPTTKAHEGHDMDISKGEILEQGLVGQKEYEQMEDYTKHLYREGVKRAEEHGLILVDTKYEFGKSNGQVLLIDEVHTPDSSRYFYLDGYKERQQRGQKQQQLSKEFVRQWLIEQGFQGQDDQQMPELPDDFIQSVSKRYIELYEKLTGEAFQPRNTSAIESSIEENIKHELVKLKADR